MSDGIESRGDKHRGYIKDHGKLARGPWGTLADAKAWRARAVANRLDGKPVAHDGPTVWEASERFLAGAKAGIVLSRKNQRYAPKTLRGYEQAFRDWICPELGHVRTTALRRSQVQRWVDWLGSQRSPGTVRNTWAALAALYSYLLPRNDDIANPTDGVRLPRPSQPRTRYADIEEMSRLMEALPDDLALPYALAFYAGLRRAEIQALPMDCVERDWITVRFAFDQSGFKGPKSGAGERVVPVFHPLRTYLQELPSTFAPRDVFVPGPLVLPSTRPSRYGVRMLGRSYLSKCEKCWKAAGLEPIGLHEARHSFITHLVRAGYDVKLVQEWAGHAQASTTLNVYAKRRGRVEGLADRMNEYLSTVA